MSQVSAAKLPAWRGDSTSMMLAACEVEPEASGVLNFAVSRPRGKLQIKLEMLTPLTARPSSALIFTVAELEATNSRPSPGMWLYTPTSSAWGEHSDEWSEDLQ